MLSFSMRKLSCCMAYRLFMIQENRPGAYKRRRGRESGNYPKKRRFRLASAPNARGFAGAAEGAGRAKARRETLSMRRSAGSVRRPACTRGIARRSRHGPQRLADKTTAPSPRKANGHVRVRSLVPAQRLSVYYCDAGQKRFSRERRGPGRFLTWPLPRAAEPKEQASRVHGKNTDPAASAFIPVAGPP